MWINKEEKNKIQSTTVHKSKYNYNSNIEIIEKTYKYIRRFLVILHSRCLGQLELSILTALWNVDPSRSQRSNEQNSHLECYKDTWREQNLWKQPIANKVIMNYWSNMMKKFTELKWSLIMLPRMIMSFIIELFKSGDETESET